MRNEHLDADVVAFVMNELDERARTQAERHLANCTACQQEVKRIRLAVSTLEPWSLQSTLPASMRKRIAARLPLRTPHYRTLQRAAVIVLVMLGSLAAGYSLGARRAPAGQNNGSALPVFALLLEEPDWPPHQPLNRTGYREWYNAQISAGQSAGGEKLTDEPGWRVRRDGIVERPGLNTCSNNLSGYFLVHARNYDDAIAWVKRGPHLRYGSVLVRQVE